MRTIRIARLGTFLGVLALLSQVQGQAQPQAQSKPATLTAQFGLTTLTVLHFNQFELISKDPALIVAAQRYHEDTGKLFDRRDATKKAAEQAWKTFEKTFNDYKTRIFDPDSPYVAYVSAENKARAAQRSLDVAVAEQSAPIKMAIATLKKPDGTLLFNNERSFHLIYVGDSTASNGSVRVVITVDWTQDDFDHSGFPSPAPAPEPEP